MFKSCDFINALLDMIPPQCVDKHFNDFVKDFGKKNIGKKGLK